MAFRIFLILFAVASATGICHAQAPNSVSVISFGAHESGSARQMSGVAVNDFRVTTAKQAVELVETLADKQPGLIVFQSPETMDGLINLPGLTPDVKFTFIGGKPVFLNNVQSISFDDMQGAYLAGTLAALYANGTIGIMSTQSSEAIRGLAYAFFQGAKHGNPAVKIVSRIGNVNASGRTLGAGELANQLFSEGVEVLFVPQREDSLEAAEAAVSRKRVIIPYTDLPPSTAGVLTSITRRPDLALQYVVRQYAAGNWQPGRVMLGLRDGFIDYRMDDANRARLPASVIEKLEATTDLLERGAITITPYTGN